MRVLIIMTVVGLWALHRWSERDRTPEINAPSTLGYGLGGIKKSP